MRAPVTNSDGHTAVFARQGDDSKVALELGGRSR